MKSVYKILLCLIIALLLSGCSQKDIKDNLQKSLEEAQTATTIEPITTHKTPPSYNESSKVISNSSSLTVEQAISDYEYMWNVLENNFPSLNMMERKLGINTDTVKKQAYDKIMSNEFLSYDALYEILSESLWNFEFTYHLEMLNPNNVDYYYTLYCQLKYEEKDIPAFMQQVSDWRKAILTYRKVNQRENPNSRFTEVINLSSQEDNIKLEILNESTVLITINSFGDTSEINKVKELIAEVSTYDNLVIDISKNLGGDDIYWMKAIVMPNIDETLEWSTNMLFKLGNENINYVKALNWTDIIIHNPNLSSYKKLNLSDIDKTYMKVVLKNKLYPESDKKIFNGNIYILIDKYTVSSAENFAQFCNETKFATLVGNHTNTGPNVNPLLIQLPNSGLVFRYCIGYTVTTDGLCFEEYGISPEYLCRESETPLQTCLRIINERKGL